MYKKRKAGSLKQIINYQLHPKRARAEKYNYRNWYYIT